MSEISSRCIVSTDKISKQDDVMVTVIHNCISEDPGSDPSCVAIFPD
jgi:hypothetical protein